MSGDQAISADEIRAGLERILASRGFANAGRLSRLLRHSVEKTLAGEIDQLKEYSVGMEVFDRGETYDPRVDSIVRVEAGRLRSRIDEYYNGEGAGDPVRITLPRGAYVAQFDRPSTATVAPAIVAAEAPPTRRSWATLPLAAAVICGVAVMVVWLGGWGSKPESVSVAVLAFQQYSASDEDGAVAAQLTDSVTAELARLGTVSVVSHTSAMQFAGTRTPVREIARTLDAAFVVEASIENEAVGLRVMVRLVNATTDRKAWVEEFHGQPDDLPTLSKTIAAAVSAALLKSPPNP